MVITSKWTFRMGCVGLYCAGVGGNYHNNEQKETFMKVTIFGMGYVGCVTAACFSNLGHDVTGVDVDANKVDMINRSQSPIIEPGLTDIIKAGASAGLLRATTDPAELGDELLVR